jgi:hypothetical protein
MGMILTDIVIINQKIMKNLITILLVFSTAFISGQHVIIWKGGTPGKEKSWDEPRNWYSNKVPDEFSNVIIKHANNGHFKMPEINGEVQIVSIQIFAKSYVTISDTGKLFIDGADTYSEGILLFGGDIQNTGVIRYENVDIGDYSRASNIAKVFYHQL